MEGLEDGVEGGRAFRSVKEQRALRAFDELRLFGFEDARCARILGFSAESISNTLNDEALS